MKKFLAMLLALALILGLAACGTAEEPAAEENDPAAEAEGSVTMTGAEASVARPTEPTLVSIAGGSSSGTMFLLGQRHGAGAQPVFLRRVQRSG